MSVQESDVERALDWLRDNADEIGRVRAAEYLLIEMRKVMKAELMQKTEGPQHVKEAYAYSHPTYKAHLEGCAAAIHERNAMDVRRVAAEAKIEAWRSQEATRRSMKI